MRCRPHMGLIFTRWRPLSEPLVGSWMAAIESGSGIGEQGKRDTCKEDGYAVCLDSCMVVEAGSCKVVSSGR